MAMIEHTIDQKHMFARDAVSRTGENLHLAALAARAIATQPQIFERQVEPLARQGAHQIGSENECADENRRHHLRRIGQARKVANHETDLYANFIFGKQNARRAHPLASANSSVR